MALWKTFRLASIMAFERVGWARVVFVVDSEPASAHRRPVRSQFQAHVKLPALARRNRSICEAGSNRLAIASVGAAGLWRRRRRAQIG